MKAFRIFLLVLIIIGLAALATYKLWVPKLVDYILSSENLQATNKNVASPLDATYTIDDEPFTLKGNSTVRYFGNEASGDLNGDGIPDVGFIVSQDSGGSGTFYYAVAALKKASGYIGTNAIFLGDRIAPQTTEIKGQQLIVNYADRAVGEPFTTKPSFGKSKYLIIHDGSLVEVSGE